MDPDNIEAIKNWTTPKNVIEVRSFMGIVGYYRRFIEAFSKVAHAITSFQRKGIKLEWTSKCEESFQWLKYLLTSASVLKLQTWRNILWYVRMHAVKDFEEFFTRTTA